jgi:hypothetical protein
MKRSIKMKMFLLFTILLLGLLPSVAMASRSQQTIGSAASALITTGPGYLKGLVVHTDGTNSVLVEIFDNTSGTGTQILSDWTVTTSATSRTTTLYFGAGDCLFNVGLYVKVTPAGGGAVVFDVYYEHY